MPGILCCSLFVCLFVFCLFLLFPGFVVQSVFFLLMFVWCMPFCPHVDRLPCAHLLCTRLALSHRLVVCLHPAEYVKKFASLAADQAQEAESDAESSLSDFSENEAQDMEF